MITFNKQIGENMKQNEIIIFNEKLIFYSKLLTTRNYLNLRENRIDQLRSLTLAIKVTLISTKSLTNN